MSIAEPLLWETPLMLDPASPNASPNTVRHLSVCHKSNPLKAEKCNVLLVEPALVPRSDSERLLKAANYCVTTALDVREMFELRFEKPVAFAVLSDLLGPFGLRAAAEAVRRQWPLAKILIIGCAAPILEDHLYDETISHRHEENGFSDVLHLLTKDSWSQRIVGGYEGFRRAAGTPSESDPTKAIAHTPTLKKNQFDVPMALQRMRATG
jgi:hypothetical protein